MLDTRSRDQKSVNIVRLAAMVACIFACLSAQNVRAQVPDLGVGASLHGKQVFPVDSPWNQNISSAPVDPNSANLIASIGLNTGIHPDFGTVYNGAPNGIPYVVVSGAQATVPISFDYADESDPGPYPIPADAPIEGGPNGSGDRHVLVVDRDNWLLYELFSAYPSSDGSSWTAGSGAVFNLNSDALRTEGWTSADAAGLPVFPGLVRYDEVVEQGEITHALRFTVQNSRRAFVAPARHYASSQTSPNLPPMGMRVRLKASFDISGYPASVQVILLALKKYGMFVADNGSNWYISGAPDSRWSDDDLHTLTTVLGSDFEVVQMGAIVTDSGNAANPAPAISGQAFLQGWMGAPQLLTFTLTLTGTTGGSVITRTATPAADGSFTLNTIPSGAYTLGIKGSYWLQKDMAVDTSSGAVTGLSVTLPAGDVNGDGVVNGADISAIAAAFRSRPGDANWNPICDINGDGVVNGADISLACANFRKKSDP